MYIFAILRATISLDCHIFLLNVTLRQLSLLVRTETVKVPEMDFGRLKICESSHVERVSLKTLRLIHSDIIQHVLVSIYLHFRSVCVI